MRLRESKDTPKRKPPKLDPSGFSIPNFNLYNKLFIANACDIILLLIKIQQHVFKMHL